MNKTRYAILGMLIDGPSSGYDITSLMKRSTAYFWRESESTVYPMLKVLAKEGKVSAQDSYVGKKKKVIFSITDVGRAEFTEWFESPTNEEIPRNEFLLKLFFAKGQKEMGKLFRERLQKIDALLKRFGEIEDRLENMGDSAQRSARLTALRYGIAQLKAEKGWLRNEG